MTLDRCFDCAGMKEMGTSGDRQDDNESVILLLPDLSAVFDHHTILLSRLANRSGVRDTDLNWFRFCLESRKQFISINDIESSMPEERSTTGNSSFTVFGLHRIG